MLWLNLGLVSLILALAMSLISLRAPRVVPAGRIVAGLALQISGVLIVTWFLVERGQALAPSLPPPPRRHRH